MKEKLQFLKKAGFTLIALLGFANFANAQCNPGEVEVSVDVTTDQWGYEFYWEIVPTGNACGTGTIFSGGNTNVGCLGGAAQAAGPTDPGAYGNSTTVTDGPFCLVIGQDYDIIMVDDWADGGSSLTNANQGINFSANNDVDVFTFTAMAPPSGPDAAVTATPAEYTIFPITQVDNIVGPGNIENIGVGTATGASIEVSVYDLGAMTQVYNETSPTDSVQAGANVNFNVTGYTPTAVGNYYVEYIASISEADGNSNNDTTGYLVQVDDSTYARDDANINGVTGLFGIGGGVEGEIGTAFDIINDDTLTSVSFFLGNTNGILNGQPISVKVYDTNGGLPNTVLATSEVITMDTTQNALYNLQIPGGLVMGPGRYVVSVVEADSNLTLGRTSNIFNTGTQYVYWNTNPWADLNGFGASFQVNPVIRPHFGVVPPGSVGIAENANTAFEVFPNPAVENIMVKNALGSTIEIYNNLGQVVFNGVANNNNFNVNVSDFDNGVYTIKSISGENTTTKSFVKQ